MRLRRGTFPAGPPTGMLAGMSTTAPFLASGSFATGVNYWASHAATEMWSRWDESVVAADLRALAGHGVRLLRVFPLWPDFQPISRLYFGDGRPAEFRLGESALPDTPAGQAGVSEVMMQRLERLCDLAAGHGMGVVVALITGQMTSRLYMPPGLAGLDPVTDPAALMWERRFIHYLVGRMRHHPAVAAWNFGNECNIMGRSPSAEAASFWMGAMADAIRLEDTAHPLVSGMDAVSGGQADDAINRSGAHWTARRQAEHCDVLAVHHYVMWKPAGSDPCDTIKPCLAPACECLLSAGITGRPTFVEEIGLNWRPMMASYATLGAYVRTVLWTLWAEDCRGLMWWCAFDQERQDMAPYDWDMPGLEHGVFSSDREPRTSAVEMGRFRACLDGLPFATLPPRERQAVVLTGDYRQHTESAALGAYLLAAQAGFAVGFQQAMQPLRPAELYILPSATGRCGLTPQRWSELKAAVRAGATLYISTDDVYLDGIADVVGAEVVRRTGKPGVGTLRFGKGEAALTLPLGHTATMAAGRAEVIATWADGSPAAFATAYGQGRVFLLPFPLETTLVETPMALHEGGREAWRIYARIAAPILARRIVAKHAPGLVLSEHPGADGTLVAVAINSGPGELCDQLEVADGWSLAAAHGDGSAVPAGDGRIALSLPGNCGAVLILRRA